VDPLGGSYAVEAATDLLEREAVALLDRIEAKGGALRAIERGEIQRDVQESAYRFQTQVEAGTRVIVGVNRFQESGPETPMETLRIDPALERQQTDRLRALRARRPVEPWKAALAAVGATARSRDNLMPALIDAVLAWATVGEIAGCLREVFGEHRETLVL
jgi:methylmalonyl-CoA mutase, N-terminal domain